MYETRYSQVNAATRGTRISFLLLLFSHLVLHTSAKSQISCFSQDPPRQRLGDCDAALNMIPNGVQDLGVDLGHLYPSDSKKPISLQFEHPGRNRTYLIPAAFRFGTCVILVGSLGWNPHPPVKAVSAMYFKVWPNVRKGCGDDSEDVSAADAEALVVVWMGGGVELAESMAVSLLCRDQMGAGGCDERRRKEADGCV